MLLQIRYIYHNIQISVVHMYLFANLFIIIKFWGNNCKLTDFVLKNSYLKDWFNHLSLIKYVSGLLLFDTFLSLEFCH